MAKRKNPDIDLRGLQRAYESGDQNAGLEFIAGLIKSGNLELSQFPLPLLVRSVDLKKLLDQRYNRQGDQLVHVLGMPLYSIINFVNETVEEFIEAHEQRDEGPTCEQRLEIFYHKHHLIFNPDNQLNERGQQSLITEVNYTTAGAEEKSHETRILYWGHTVIEVMLTSQYNTEYSDITIENYRNQAQPNGLLRKLTFNIESQTLHLLNIEIIADLEGLWQDKARGEKQLKPVGNALSLMSDIQLPYEGAPRLITGSCEDKPCCGHDICPPRWSHDGSQAAMVCAFCNGYVEAGSRYSSHEKCIRNSMRQEDGDSFGYGDEPGYDEEDEDSNEEDSDDEDEEEYQDEQEWEQDPPDYYND